MRLLAVWFAWFALMSGANVATPLYAVYAKHFGFSSLVLTAVFATYAFVLVPALVAFGRLSDRFGRRPVVLVGLMASAASLFVFLFAENVAWLFAGRALQGLAVGMISGAATAALVELDPRDDRRRAALLAGLAQAGGSAAGPIAAGVLGAWAPDPLRVPYVVWLGVTAVAAVLVLRVPAADIGDREPLRVQWPRVPREVRGAFFRVGLTAGLVWGAVALSLSIVPSYAAAFLHTHDLALLAAVSAVALVASCVTQAVALRRRGNAHVDQAIGLALLALGLVGLAASSPLSSLAVLLAGGVAAGAGHGLAFVSAQEELNDLAPPERRGEITSAFIACIYFVVASTVLLTGVLDQALSLAASVGVVSVALVFVSASACAWQLSAARRTRRAPTRRDPEASEGCSPPRAPQRSAAQARPSAGRAHGTPLR
jgi:MFS family permease